MDDYTPPTNGPEESEEPTHSPSDSHSIWDDEAAVANLSMEKALHPYETNQEMAKRFLEEAVPNVAQGIIRLALSANNENTKLNAQKAVLDMVFNDGAGGSKPKWEQLLGDAVSEVELHANNTTPTD